MKSAKSLMPVAMSATPNSGQDYNTRVAKGRKEFSFWLPDAESHDKLGKLAQAMGAKSAKDAMVQLLQEAFAKYGL